MHTEHEQARKAALEAGRIVASPALIARLWGVTRMTGYNAVKDGRLKVAFNLSRDPSSQAGPMVRVQSAVDTWGLTPIIEEWLALLIEETPLLWLPHLGGHWFVLDFSSRKLLKAPAEAGDE